MKYLIIGNGIAGLSAAKEITNRDNDGEITIVTKEPYPTYYRLKLSHYISKEFEDEGLFIHKEDWYRKNNTNLILGKIAESINIENNFVRLDDGNEIHYDKLLIASGSRPFIPPIAGKYKDGVFALRTLKDLRHIKKYFSLCDNITVIGGGLLGLEAAWAIKELGKKVSVVEFSPYLLPRQLDEEISEKLSKRLTSEGLNLYLNTAVKEITGEIRADGILTNNGNRIKTDAILISAGVRPNIDLAIDSKIKYNKGIIADQYLKTNIENIYVAGDVAEVEGMVIGLWTIANEQGKIAGQNMVGENVKYSLPKPFTTLRIGDISMFSAGDVKEFDEVIEYKKGESYHKLFVKENKVNGVILTGDISKMSKVKKAVVNKINIGEYIKRNMDFEEIVEKF